MPDTETQDSQYEKLIGLLEMHDWDYIDAPTLTGFIVGSEERSKIEALVQSIGTQEAKFLYVAYKAAYLNN